MKRHHNLVNITNKIEYCQAMCSGFGLKGRDKSKQHLMVYSTNPRASPHTSTRRREGNNPLENALKPQLYIFNYSKIYIV